MTPHDITLRERVDELRDENMRLDMRIRELESINTYLCETLEEIKWSCNQVDVDAASWLAQAALVKVRGER